MRLRIGVRASAKVPPGTPSSDKAVGLPASFTNSVHTPSHFKSAEHCRLVAKNYCGQSDVRRVSISPDSIKSYTSVTGDSFSVPLCLG